MSMLLVMDFLLTRPEGAKAREIADGIGISVYNVSDALGRLVKRNKVKPLAPHTNRLSPIWVSTVIVSERKSFGGADALKAMQRVAKAHVDAQIASNRQSMSAILRNLEAA